MYIFVCTNRVLKEAMRTGGSNLTQEHAEDLSLCALFLMEAAKKVDREFGVTRSTSHSTRDADKDIGTVTNNLLERKVTQELPERTSSVFSDPTNNGLDKLCNTKWVHDVLSRTDCEFNLEEGDLEDRVTDQDYELYNIT